MSYTKKNNPITANTADIVGYNGAAEEIDMMNLDLAVRVSQLERQEEETRRWKRERATERRAICAFIKMMTMALVALVLTIFLLGIMGSLFA